MITAAVLASDGRREESFAEVAKRKTSKAAGVAPVQLDADANQAIQAWCDRRDIIKRGVLSKLSRWFLRQPITMQQVILQEEPPELREAFATALEEMAERVRRQEGSGPDYGAVMQATGRILDEEATTAQNVSAAESRPAQADGSRSARQPHAPRGKAAR